MKRHSSKHDVFVDETRQVRDGEELDASALGAFLRQELGGDGEVEISQFPGGHSNLTYLVRYGGEEYVLRRPPFGSKVKSAHDMGREFRVLSKLAPVYPRAPQPVAHCTDTSILGAEFYLMRRVYGVILRKRPPEGLAIDADMARQLSETLIEALAELHGLDYEAAGLGDFGRPDGYAQRQIEGWTRRYHDARTDDIAGVDRVSRWLADRLPPPSAPGLIHNDFKFDNLVLDPDDLTRVIGILDWEMSTVGEPLMDLGTTLCYWIQHDDPQPLQMMRFGPTTWPGMLTRRQLVDRYASRSGRPTDDIVYYYAYGLFKTAVVAQQIYYRFAKGYTRDQRFAQMIYGVRLLIEQAEKAIDSGEL